MESRFQVGFKEAESNAIPGLVIDDDEVVWLIKPDHTRVQVGEGGGACAYFTCDTDQGIATVDAPNAVVIQGVATVTAQAVGEVGGAPVVTASAVTDGGIRALYEAGIGGTADEDAYADMSAVSVTGDKGASVGVAANDDTGGNVTITATDLIAAIARYALVTAQSTVATDNVDSAIAANDELGQTRATQEVLYEGSGNGHALARMLAQELEDGTAAQIELTATTGDPSAAHLRADLLSFDQAVSPIARPTLDAATCTAADVANALIALGLCTAA